MITALKEHEVFTFGSNTAGRHGAGAARQALTQFGAVYGVGEGLTGKCYALPTLDHDLNQRSDEDLTASIETFFAVARDHPEKTFLLTKVGCGLAGYDESYMQSKFTNAPENVVLPEDWCRQK